MRDVNDLVVVVFSGLASLVVEDVADEGQFIRVRARPRDDPVQCPVCGQPTGRVHGIHRRMIADVPTDGGRVVYRCRSGAWSARSWAAPGRRSVNRSPA